MAPDPLDIVDDSLKQTINALFMLQSNAHAYVGDETHTELIEGVKNLATSLANFQNLPSHPSNADRSASSVPALLPPEVIGYVDEGRNPDIYTREFVELVQRGNAYLKGKSEGLMGLRDALAEEMSKEWPEMKDIVEKVVNGEGGGLERMRGGKEEEQGEGNGHVASA